MKKAVAKLENFLDRIEGQTKGKVVLATVYGDVHDIGKSLVNTILSNNGYTTFDLGRQVPINVILEKASEVGADAIGLSALLVSTSKQMPLCLQRARRARPRLPGADRRRGDQPLVRPAHLAPRGRPSYARRRLLLQRRVRGARHDRAARTTPSRRPSCARSGSRGRASTWPRCRGREPSHPQSSRASGPTCRALPVPSVPFLGAPGRGRRSRRRRLGRDGQKTLYKSSWGAKNARGEELERAACAPTSSRAGCACSRRASSGLARAARRVRLLPLRRRRRGAGDLRRGRRVRAGPLQFPRQERHDRLCIADYFRTIDDDERDIVAFQVVTVGREAQEHIDALYAAEEYSEQYFAHGIAIAATEGMAEIVHRRVKPSWACPPTRAGATRGAIRRVRTSSATCWCSTCSARRGGDRHRAHDGVPVRPGAVDRGDRRAPPERHLLLGAPLRAGRRARGRRQLDVSRRTPPCVPVTT